MDFESTVRVSSLYWSVKVNKSFAIVSVKCTSSIVLYAIEATFFIQKSCLGRSKTVVYIKMSNGFEEDVKYSEF